MSEYIDRVAEAIFSGHDWSFTPNGGFAAQEPHIQEIFRSLAKAAIAAMEQPSRKMMDAAHEVGIDMPPDEYWRAMITAELKPPFSLSDTT